MYVVLNKFDLLYAEKWILGGSDYGEIICMQVNLQIIDSLIIAQ